MEKRKPGYCDTLPGDGEFFCLLGPSGCWKTTTLNLIGGFVQVSSGEILIEGERADRIPPYKRNVNTVFQNCALFPHLSVFDNVGFGPKMARVSKRDARPRVQEALRLVGLDEHADRFPAQLSGGQQQRVAAARARQPPGGASSASCSSSAQQSSKVVRRGPTAPTVFTMSPCETRSRTCT